MRLQTSFYMNVVTCAKLAKALRRTGLSMHHLIVQVRYNYVKRNRRVRLTRGTVRYQNVNKRENWRLFRVSLLEEDYELFTDMRKVLKKSVSLLVALAVKKYLGGIVSKILKDLFNYTYLIRDSFGIRIGELKKWIFKWILKENSDNNSYTCS